ncbi:MAG: glucosamine-6-phosphate deaminase [Verrucomicrobiaceae bacterium]|nr:MAG: glucosamine-6-phosphate deaminase [Verrucomicrobiaceae bacterium]
MGRAAAADAARVINGALTQRGEARVILASAPSQNELLENLLATSVDWSRVTIFHMDEYVGLPADHPATFRSYQQQHVLSRIHPKAFHGIRGESPDTVTECSRYAALLCEAPIDVVCLGIGENGHLAFNDPPVADFTDPLLVKVVELDEICQQQQVNDGCFPSIDAVPRQAITLTIPALLGGRELVCIVPGPRKAAAVRAALHGPVDTSCPASILRRHSNARLYLDTASASPL